MFYMEHPNSGLAMANRSSKQPTSLDRPLPESVLTPDFFNRDPQLVACDLIGKVLSHRVPMGAESPGIPEADGAAPTSPATDDPSTIKPQDTESGLWLSAMIVETEAYYLDEKASHASLGFTEKRKALFMPPGTVYMYYARGGDSFNISCAGEGNAVLLKAGIPHERSPNGSKGMAGMLASMHRLNPAASGEQRPTHRLCSGQTLLCRALGLRVPEWDQQPLPQTRLGIVDAGHRPPSVIRTTRLGIPEGRDGHLPYRFVHGTFSGSATKNPLTRGRVANKNHHVLIPSDTHLPWDGMLDILHSPENP